jgi:hypothetical protein
MKLLLINILNFLYLSSVEILPDKSQNREYIETINNRLKEL